jgi:4-diphosphocytidyl-2-C-methyl-D-erythritol kinase
MQTHAPAKLNLCLFLGPRREDGLHELCSLFEPLALADRILVEDAESDRVLCEGIDGENLAALALASLREQGWGRLPQRIEIEKRIPVAAGLGGGSSDAATAINLATSLLAEPLPAERTARIAAGLGVDVPFFLKPGPKLGTGDGTILQPIELPQGYSILIVLPHGKRKTSTAEIYGRFSGAAGFPERRDVVLEVAAAGRGADLASLPSNDLAESPLSATLRALGAFRADVSGAGPAVYGLFHDGAVAEAAAAEIGALGKIWLTSPAW